MVHLWRVSSVSSAPLLEPEEEDAGGLDGADGEGFGGSNGGSKGEAADIRVSRCVVFFARISTRKPAGVTFHSPRRPPHHLTSIAVRLPPCFARSTSDGAVRKAEA